MKLVGVGRRGVVASSARRIFIRYAFVALVGVALAVPSLATGVPVIGGDAAYPELAPSVAFHRDLSTWGSYAGFGKNISFGLPILIPFAALDYLVSELFRVDYIRLNIGWLLLLWGATSLCAYRLYRALFSDDESIVSALIVALIAAANPYVLITRHSPYLTSDLSTAVTPALLGAAILAFRGATAWRVLETSLWAVIVATGANNYGIAAAELAVTIVVLAGYTAARPTLRSFSIALSLATVYVCANAAWWTTAFLDLTSHFAGIASASLDYSLTTLAAVSRYSSPENSVRLVGEYLFFNAVHGTPYIPEGWSYRSNPLVVAATSAVPLAAFACVLVARGQARRAAIALSLIALAALAIAKGSSGLFGAAFADALQLFHPLYAFRDPFSKFEWIVVTAYAVLAARTTFALRERNARWGVVTSVAVLGCAGIAGYPILAGHAFWAQARVRVPERYFTMAREMENDVPLDGRILQLPVGDSAFDTYRWGYVGAGINYELIDRAIISRASDFNDELNKDVDDISVDPAGLPGRSQYPLLLGLLGVSHVLTDSSYDAHFLGAAQRPTLAPTVGRSVVVARHATLTLRRLDPADVNARLYVADRVVSYTGPLVTFGPLCRALGTCRGVAIVARDGGTLHTVRSLGGAQTKLILSRRSQIAALLGSGKLDRTGSPHYDITDGPLSTTISRPAQTLSYRLLRLASLLLHTGRHASAARSSWRAISRSGGVHFACTSAAAGSSFARSYRLRPGQPVDLVAFRVSKLQGHAYFTLSDGVKRYIEYMSGERGHNDVVRIVRPSPQATALRVSLSMDPTQRPDCVTIVGPFVGALASEPGAPLTVETGVDRATTAFAATNGSLYEQLADIAWRRNDNRARRLTLRAFPSQFSLPEPYDAGAAPLPFVHAIQRRGAISVVGAEDYDIHAGFPHLIPHLSYKLRVRVLEASGAWSAAVIDPSGAVLGKAQIAQGVGTVRFRASAATQAILYVYHHHTASEPAPILRVARPELDLDETPDRIVAVVNRPKPAALSVRKRDVRGLRYQISLNGAPSALVVFGQGFAPSWRLSCEEGRADISHIVVNEGQNGYVVSNARTCRTYRLQYDGDVPYYVSAFAGLVGLLGVNAAWFLRNRRPRIRASRAIAVP